MTQTGLPAGWQRYAPGLTPSGGDPEAAWYQPAHTLGQHSLAVQPGDPALAAGADPTRKFVLLRNFSTTDTVYWGDTDQVTTGPAGDAHAGVPLFPGESVSLDQREYDGDVWVVSDPSAAVVDLRVSAPSTGA